jgi:hypothetical protein
MVRLTDTTIFRKAAIGALMSLFLLPLFARAQSSSLSDLDALRYIASYGDLIRVFGADASKGRSHYEQSGVKEGRKITFEPLDYTASHPDLIAAFGIDEVRAVTHYIQSGFKENREITFKPLNYIASYPDLIAAFGADKKKGSRHYIQSGFYEKRSITFDPFRYMASHPDLIQALSGDEARAAAHYIEVGMKERRPTTFSDLDALQYVASFSELIKSVGADASAAIRHYVTIGYNAGKRITFDALAYIASYGDLIAAFSTNAMLGVQHYLNSGYEEGRRVVFDALGYLAAHADLRAAFGSNVAAATKHYITTGYAQRRGYLWTVSVKVGAGGTATLSRAYVETGKTVMFFVNANSGYRIGNVVGCGGTTYGGLPSQTSFTTGPITGTCEVEVSFVELKPKITISDSSLNFEKVTVSLTSQTKTLTIKNDGTAPLSLSAISLVGADANQFSVSSACGAIVSEGSGCSIGIAFRPTSAGVKNASVSVKHNAGPTDLTVPLQGTGVDYISECNNCVNLRPVSAGDQWVYAVVEQVVGVVTSPVASTLTRSVSVGPTYSAGGSKSQLTLRVTDSFSSNGVLSITRFYDAANEPGDGRVRMIAKGSSSTGGFTLEATSFSAGNYPTLFVSPIGVGAAWAFDSLLVGPPCAGCGSQTYQVERYQFSAKAVALENVQTGAGNFNAIRVDYKIVCRRGYLASSSLTPINLECAESKYLGETGTYWVHPVVGIVQYDTVIESGFPSSFVPERVRVTARLSSTNVR